jgi:hypothetical protein
MPKIGERFNPWEHFRMEEVLRASQPEVRCNNKKSGSVLADFLKELQSRD